MKANSEGGKLHRLTHLSLTNCSLWCIILGMLKFLRQLNLEKGATSIAELLLVMTTATVVIGGITLNVSDILNEADDTQRVANLRQIVTALEIYYSDHENYPRADFDGLISELINGNYLGSSPTTPEKYEYQYFNGGENYILKTSLENPESDYLEADLDGEIGGIDCQDPYFCLKM